MSRCLGSLAALMGFSVYLAATRTYQVDECMEVVVARILVAGQASTSLRNIGPCSPCCAVSRDEYQLPLFNCRLAHSSRFAGYCK